MTGTVLSRPSSGLRRGDGTALASYAWGYDLAGNMTSQTFNGVADV